jgi:hypothetical protein
MSKINSPWFGIDHMLAELRRSAACGESSALRLLGEG